MTTTDNEDKGENMDTTSATVMQGIVRDINEKILAAIMDGTLDTMSDHHIALDVARCVLEEAIAGGTLEDMERLVRRVLWPVAVESVSDGEEWDNGIHL